MLVDNWRDIVRRAWSVRLIGLSLVMMAAQAALPYLGDVIPPRIMATATFLVTIGAGLSRIMTQKNLED